MEEDISGQIRESEDSKRWITVGNCYGFGSQGLLYGVTFENSHTLSSIGMSGAEIREKYPRTRGATIVAIDGVAATETALVEPSSDPIVATDYIGIGGSSSCGSLTIDEYDREAARTAVYPGSGTGDLTYPILGLIGETGELAEHAKKMLRDDGGTLTPARRTAMLGEAGDVLWYLSAVAREERSTLRAIAYDRVEFPLNPTDWTIARIMRDLGRCVGRISGEYEFNADVTTHAGGVVIHNTGERRYWMLGAIWDLAALAQALGSTLAEVAAMNAAKLRSRQERGVLGGSGSER